MLVGTSGFSYPDWTPSVYPVDLPRNRTLEYYKTLFPFNGLNSTYYHMPRSGFGTGLSERTGPDFRFAVKSPGLLTHRFLLEENGKPADATVNDRSVFIERALEFNNLAGVLFQFPFSFHYTNENRRYLDWLLDGLQAGAFCEFRNPEWNKPVVYRSLEDRKCGWVLYDAPPGCGLPSLEDQLAASGSVAPSYLRLHGRNTRTWWKGDNVTRYAHDYTERELAEIIGLLADFIEPPAVRAPRVRPGIGHGIQYVAFNNHHKGRAVFNAQKFIELTMKSAKR